MNVANVMDIVAIPFVLNCKATWLDSSVDMTALVETATETLFV